MGFERDRVRFAGSGMRLGISKVAVTTLSFGLRHFVAFYLLGLLVALPSYLHSFLPKGLLQATPGENWPEGQDFPALLLQGLELPRPKWETEFAVPMVEIVLLSIATAVATQVRLRDRRGEDWTAFPSLVSAMRQWWTVLGVGILCGLGAGGAQYLVATIPFSGFVVIPLSLIAAMILCVVMPCAAIANTGIIDCFERSALLTDGSRLRIFAVYLMSAVGIVGAALALGTLLEEVFQLENVEITPLWGLMASALAGVYFVPLTVVIHEALLALKNGPDAQAQASVFS